MSTEHVTLDLPIQPENQNQIRFHKELATAEVGEHSVSISGGYGFGHTEVYVSIDGKRVLTVDTQPMLQALTEKALTLAGIEVPA